jgi:hypothetical protein
MPPNGTHISLIGPLEIAGSTWPRCPVHLAATHAGSLDMPPIVIAFHYRNSDAVGGMIWCYAGAKRDSSPMGGITP